MLVVRRGGAWLGALCCMHWQCAWRVLCGASRSDPFGVPALGDAPFSCDPPRPQTCVADVELTNGLDPAAVDVLRAAVRLVDRSGVQFTTAQGVRHRSLMRASVTYCAPRFT